MYAYMSIYIYMVRGEEGDEISIKIRAKFNWIQDLLYSREESQDTKGLGSTSYDTQGGVKKFDRINTRWRIFQKAAKDQSTDSIYFPLYTPLKLVYTLC